MSTIIRFAAALLMLMAVNVVNAQTTVKGKIIDAATKEPIAGASVHCTMSGCHCGCMSDADGNFEFKLKDGTTAYLVSIVGYKAKSVQLSADAPMLIVLEPSQSLMQEVVVSANRESVKRSHAPIAITSINQKMLQDAKVISADQLLNKVSGVYMVNLGNEQHQMSIRQPMTTKSLFLYLEDGIPVRTTGLFNHNALLEMNMAATKSIEVIKGPSSSLYGSEAIGGVVNFITISPTKIPLLKFSSQLNDLGYKRADLQSSFTSGDWGFALSGYYADKRNGFIEYSDFTKKTFTARLDYKFSPVTSISHSVTWLKYSSDMNGSIDSSKFANRSFLSQQTFTYRNVEALRYRSTFTHNWSDRSKTTASLVFRENMIAQNPAYSLRNDYRKVNNGTWTGNKALAHGEENTSAFNSYNFIAQHRQSFSWKDAVLIGGVSVDLSPANYKAEYIRIDVDTVIGKYAGYEKRDSLLTNYKTNINNYAGFAHFEFTPVSKLRVVASLRYDLFGYRFDNHLKPSSFSGSPDTINTFSAISPKLGLTYNFSKRTGFYANYSQGFVPPQVTEMYRGVKVPDIKSSTFYNYEVGGWMEIIKDKLSADVSLYRLLGTNEIISMRLDDGTSENRNAGKTLHKGVEAGLNANITKDVSFRMSGAYSKHRFVQFVEKGNNYNGFEMNGAPRWMHNAEVWYKPSFVKGFRVGAEWQKVGSYYLDPKNTARYKGYDVVNLRAGYAFKAFDVWVNAMNVFDSYYAYIASKSSSGYNYTPGEPRNFNAGISYDFGKLLKR
jgi:outer membrane receptor protein involved in Fe transport